MEPKVVEAIGVEFVSHHNRKSTGLVNNVNPDVFLEGRRSWYPVDFEEPVYVHRMTFETDGYTDWHEFEIEVELVDGQKRHQRVKIKDGYASFSLGFVAKSFLFRPDSKWGKAKITSLTIEGLSIEDLRTYERVVEDLVSARSTTSDLNASIDELTSQKRQLQQDKENLDSDVGTARAELKTLETSVETSESQLESVSSDLKDVRQSLKEVRDERRKVSSELNTLKNELKIFPSQIAGFVREGNRNILWYTALSVPFVAILFVVMNSLFSSAVSLMDIWKSEREIDIWTVFLIRIPFVLVALALIETCGYVVGRFIFEIVRINRQRLELAKLSLVARDVSASAGKYTDLTDDEIFEKEQVLKMELLREYMQGYTGAEFEYRGSAFISTILSVAKRFAGVKNSE